MLNFKKYLKFIGLGLTLILLSAVMVRQEWFLGIQLGLQNWFYDYDRPSPEIVIVAIDESSLQADHLGALTQWPRENYARAIEILNEHGAAAIGIDITFPDPSSKGSKDDQRLAEAVVKNKNVVMASHYFFENGIREFEWPNNSLLESDPIFGWINVQQDADGFVRRLPVFTESDRGMIEAFSVALSRIYLNADPGDYRITDDTFNYSKAIGIPVVSKMSKKNDGTKEEMVHLMNINYFAEPNQFQHISFADLLTENFVDKKGQPLSLEGKIAIIGPTAIDLQDDYLSPVSSGVKMPGVEIHANNVQTIITGEFLKDQSTRSLWLVLLTLIIVNIGIFSFIRVRYSLPLMMVEIFGLLVGGIVAYEFQLLMNVVYPIIVVLLAFAGTYLLRFILEQKERKFIEGAFGRYVNKTVVKQIQQNPEALKLGGDKRKLSVFFSDIAGFTSISEQMTPEELVTFLNEYLGEMTEIILSSGGTVDKYEGDAIMAFWNAPLSEPEHALKACLAALKNQERLAELRQKWVKRGLPEMRVRIGINTGEAVVGNMGSANRFNYTAMGDNVNLASRLEGINKQYGTYLMISEHTYEAVKDHFICRELDQIRVKGKKDAVRVYELLAKKEDETSELKEKIQQYHQGLALYREMKFQEAMSVFKKLSNDPPAQVFAKRCEEFLKTPPAKNWDGVWTFEVK